MHAPRSLDLAWHGPFAWPGAKAASDPNLADHADLAAECGVYLWTVEHAAGYLIYAAGITRRPFKKRFREHTRAYRSGVYTIFDVAALQSGVRTKVWEGFWFKKRSLELQKEYQDRTDEIRTATEDLLTSYRVFFAPLAPIPRLLERIEAAIMQSLYAANGPASVVPDRGMALSPRWPEEPPILIYSNCSVFLHGLPQQFEA